jgi:starch synthase (maltosyl-transferring)
MVPKENEQWTATFKLEKQGLYSYFVEGWVDYALNWQHGTERKIQDNQYVKSELLEGAEYVKAVLKFANDSEKSYLEKLATHFTNESDYHTAIQEAISSDLHHIFKKYPIRFLENKSKELQVYVDRKKHCSVLGTSFFPVLLPPKKENMELSKIANDCCQELLQWALIPCIFRLFILLGK